jgi:hypothetical protein
MDSSLDVLARVTARFTGPMHARFIVQPLMAVFLGIRDGVRDAHQGAPPFLWDVCSAGGRGPKIARALKRLMIPIVIAIVLDAIVQYLLFHDVRVLGAVILGTILMGLPYSIARSLANRIASAQAHRRSEQQLDQTVDQFIHRHQGQGERRDR